MPDLNRTSINDLVAAELRAHAARRGRSGAELARRLNVPKMWVSRRLSAAVEISVSDLLLICEALDVVPLDVLAQVMSDLDNVPAKAATP